MPKKKPYIFILWGDGFDEVVATIFVTQLRAVGLRVKVVGLSLQQICGAHGLTLLPDLTLDEALPLAAKVACLIIPYDSPGIIRLRNDPRLTDFFQIIQSNGVRFIVGALPAADLINLGLVLKNNILIYPDDEDMLVFAREVAELLLASME